MSDLREQLADVQHEIWAHWMKYMFTQCEPIGGMGEGLFIPEEKVLRWKRQMNTSYSDLSFKEQESDRHQADNVMEVLNDK